MATHVEVTAEDIGIGRRNCGFNCAVAKAARRSVPDFFAVGTWFIQVKGYRYHAIDARTRDWMALYDVGDPTTEPFGFDVNTDEYIEVPS